MQAFFTSVLVRYFIVWRTTKPHEVSWPALPSLLQDLSDNLPDNFGGYSWSLLIIMAETFDLVNWKAEKTAANVLSTLELAKRAHEIESRLTELVQPTASLWEANGYLNLHANGTELTACINQTAPPEYNYRFSGGSDDKSRLTLNMKNQYHANAIMAHATLIFLYTVVSGPNPRVPEIQRTATSAMLLLKEAEKAIVNRQIAVAWPLSIIASMVDPEKKEECRWVTDLLEIARPQHSILRRDNANSSLDCGIPQFGDDRRGFIDW